MGRFLVEVTQLVTHDEDGNPLKRRDQYWERIGMIDQYLRLNIILRFNDVSTWRIRCIPGTDQAKLLKPGRGVVIWYEGMEEPLLSGRLTSIERYWDDSNRGPGSVDFIGHCDNQVLANHIWTPTPEWPTGSGSYTGRFSKDYDQQSDYSFRRMVLEISSQQFGPLSEMFKYGETYLGHDGGTYRRAGETEGYRTLPGYDLPTTTEPGVPGGLPYVDEYPVVSFKSRFDNMLEVFREKAATAVDENGNIKPCGFRFVWDPETKKITPKVFYPTNIENAPENTFSPELGNLIRFQYTIKEPGPNRAFFAFDGEGKDRNIHFFPTTNFNPDTGSAPVWPLDEWGTWKEEFLDRRDQPAPASLTDPDEKAAAEAEIKQAKLEFYEASKPVAALSMEVIDTEFFKFGRDYFLGDYVQVDIDGEMVTDILREVHLVEEEGRFTITPTVGTGDASETPKIYQQVRAISSRLDVIGKRHNG